MSRSHQTPTPLQLRDDQVPNHSDHEVLAVAAFRSLLHTAARLQGAMDARLRQDGLTTRQAALLTYVEATGSPSLTQAADALGCSRQNVRQLADALVRKGFLEIRPATTDARVNQLAVTPASRHHWQERDPSDVAAVGRWFRNLDEPALRTLVEQLATVRADIQDDLPDPLEVPETGSGAGG